MPPRYRDSRSDPRVIAVINGIDRELALIVKLKKLVGPDEQQVLDDALWRLQEIQQDVLSARGIGVPRTALELHLWTSSIAKSFGEVAMRRKRIERRYLNLGASEEFTTDKEPESR
jgi:hypothetical protein